MPHDPSEAGVGQRVSPADALWQAAAAELTPAKSLARVEAKAAQVVTSVSVVGALLTGLGLVASGSLTRSAPVRALAIATVATAVLAVLLAVGSVLLRFTPALAPGNLAEVQAWYRRQFRRTYLVMAAGMLLLVAVALAGAAGLLALTTDGTDEPELAVQLVGTGADATLTVHAAFPDLPPGRLLHVEVVGMGAADARTVLARAVGRPPSSDVAFVNRAPIISDDVDAGTAETGYHARLFCQLVLPYKDLGEHPFWERRNGDFTLTVRPAIETGPDGRRRVGYPFGSLPRLLLSWIATEAARNRSPELVLGESLTGFMRQLGMSATGGRTGSITRLRKQINRLFDANIIAEYHGDRRRDVLCPATDFLGCHINQHVRITSATMRSHDLRL